MEEERRGGGGGGDVVLYSYVPYHLVLCEHLTCTDTLLWS